MTPEKRIERARMGAAARWARATAEDRARNGSSLNRMTPEELSARNRANVKSRWAKKRKAEKQAGRAA
jgi:hypothetical protein